MVVDLIGQQCRDFNGRLSVSRDVIGSEECKKSLVYFDQSFVSQKSVCLLLIKLSVVCLFLVMMSISRLQGAGSCGQWLSGVCSKLVNQLSRVSC